jgi:hypothetical protein
MKTLSLLFGLALLGAFAAGCGAGKTQEEIEAAKYPQVKPLTPEEEAKARELAQSRPPSTPQPGTQ